MDQQQDLGAIMYVNFPWDSPYDENGDLIQQYRPTTWINSDATNYLYDLHGIMRRRLPTSLWVTLTLISSLPIG